jgi:hypothetical protein
MTQLDPLFQMLKRLPTDYADYGGEIERWADGDNYPDCSCGCKYFLPLEGELGADWGVCGNPWGPRAGLLTFEHQAGRGCFNLDQEDFDLHNAVMQEMSNEWKLENN